MQVHSLDTVGSPILENYHVTVSPLKEDERVRGKLFYLQS